jgi:hypothetical protein
VLTSLHATLLSYLDSLKHGWVRIPNAVPKKHIELFTKDIWIRLGYDKDDPSTWEEERFRMPRQREMPSEFAPKAYGTMCEYITSLLIFYHLCRC